MYWNEKEIDFMIQCQKVNIFIFAIDIKKHQYLASTSRYYAALISPTPK